MSCFKFALRGLLYTIKTEKNMRVHLCFAFYIVLAGFVTGITQAQWAAVLICIALVTAAECVNTAIERTCDTLHPDKSDGIMHAKDASAAAVFCLTVVAAIIGGVIFLNCEKFQATWEFCKAQPVLAVLIVLTLIPASIFTFKRNTLK